MTEKITANHEEIPEPSTEMVELSKMPSFDEHIQSRERTSETKEDAEQLDEKAEREIREKIRELYDDPDLSVGVHGTVGIPEEIFDGDSNSFFKRGIVSKYRDLRRTISFQDKGYVHAHGEATFDEIMNYDFPSRQRPHPLSLERQIKHVDEKCTYYTTEQVPAKQFSVIVAIPKSVERLDDEILRDKETKIDHAKSSYYKKDVIGEPLKPEFIVGLYTDGDPNTMIWNPDFNADRVKTLGAFVEEQSRIAKEKAEEAQRSQVKEVEDAPVGDKRPVWSKIFRRKNK